jgi:selenocysteine-specific elongation factor
MRVIGTAGHVDHGKSTLIAALTGTHPDRLKEEKEREMTIELGFAWLTLPDGEEVGFVDVPGHRDFIGNMLAGVGGIDAVLLIIAADEGVMPQTREHLSILDLLQVRTGVVVLTKIDIIQDPDWLDLVEADIRTTLQGTVLENAPILRVSSRTKAGLNKLTETMALLLKGTSPRPDFGRPRLPIDRVFSISGFGTVVTGTLLDGKFNTGDEIKILPSGRSGRIRGLQNHKKKEVLALPGSRTAMNISGLDVNDVQRGEVVITPGQYQSTRLLDVNFHLLQNVSGPLRHGSEVKFFIGTSETIAKVRLLGIEVLEPDQAGWLQLDLRVPVVTVRGDRFILRRPSPGETLGGGKIVDPQPRNRHKRFSMNIIKELESLDKGSPSEILLQTSQALGPSHLKDLVIRSRLEEAQVDAACEHLVNSGQLLFLDGEFLPSSRDRLVIAQDHWFAIGNQIEQIISDYHGNHPLKSGMPREELKSKLGLSPQIYGLIISKLSRDGRLTEKGSLILKPGFEIKFSVREKVSIQELFNRFSQSPFSPPSVKECIGQVGENVFVALLETGELRQVSDEVVFLVKDYDSLVLQTRKFLEQYHQITVAEARDLFKTSRRFILPFLEYLDSAGITTRNGDVRHLKV